MAGTQADDGIQPFRDRIASLNNELMEINKELGRQDLLAMARKARDLVRSVKTLLEGNQSLLFGDKPRWVVEDVEVHIQYAQGHIAKALSEEYEFEIIKKRLYMATALTEYVMGSISRALEEYATTL